MLRHLVLSGVLAGSLFAQSPLTTLYAGGNGLGAGATVYFDVVLNAPLTFTQIDVNSSSTAGTSGSVEVRWIPNSYVGSATNPGAWTLGGSGPVSAAGVGLPTTCTLSPFSLPAGNYGFAVTHVGVATTYTNGNGTAVPGTGTNQMYGNVELTLLAGASAGGAVGTAICCEPRVFNGSLHYVVSAGGTIAQKTNYGAGCYLRLASMYELFATSAAFDLANSGISWVPAGTGYVVLPGIATFVAPSAGAAILTLADDADTSVTLTAPFVYPGGSTSTLVVCSNGYVSVGAGNGTGFTPSVATMLGAPQTAWRNMHDYNPTYANGGRIKFEMIAGVAYITWDGVWDHLGTSATNANTFQFQFDTATGNVHLVCLTMSTLGNARMVSYSPGGASGDPGPTDLSAALPASITLPGNDIQPLRLTASARPLIGTTISLTTDNQTGTNVGVTFLGLGQIPAPGFDLGILGAPGCAALIDVNQAAGAIISNAGLPGIGMAISLPIPNNTGLLTAQLFCQSIWLDPLANGFGALTSNGVELVLGNL